MLVTRSCSRPAGNAERNDADSDGLKTTWSEHTGQVKTTLFKLELLGTC